MACFSLLSQQCLDKNGPWTQNCVEEVTLRETSVFLAKGTIRSESCWMECVCRVGHGGGECREERAKEKGLLIL